MESKSKPILCVIQGREEVMETKTVQAIDGKQQVDELTTKPVETNGEAVQVDKRIGKSDSGKVVYTSNVSLVWFC